MNPQDARRAAPNPPIEPVEAGGMLPPPGAPKWVTAELMLETCQTWQPYYNAPLTADDVLEIIRSIGQLVDLIGEPPP